MNASRLRNFPARSPLPFLSTGATDSASLRLHKVQAYGLEPFPLTEEDDRRVHGDDEQNSARIAFTKASLFLYHVVHPRTSPPSTP